MPDPGGPIAGAPEAPAEFRGARPSERARDAGAARAGRREEPRGESAARGHAPRADARAQGAGRERAARDPEASEGAREPAPRGPRSEARSRSPQAAPGAAPGAAPRAASAAAASEEAALAQSFRAFALAEDVQQAIAAMGIAVPTPIQAMAIPHVLNGKDLIAKAETGTGKTLAFGAPMVSKLDAGRSTVLGLVLCPTRELAQQVHDVLVKLGAPRGLKTALVVGGEPLNPQVDALKRGAQLVVGTPGRVLDLYRQRFLAFPWTEFAVLDEADKMLEIGFLDDVRMILSYLPDERQTLLFSATFPPPLLSLARESTRTPIELATARGVATVKEIEQLWIPVERDDKPLALIRLFEQSGDDDVFLVFCDRREDVDQLMRRLERLPYSIKALHGGYDQAARFRVMGAFRTGDVKALVATDVASRGLDVEHVSHVINWGPPREISEYTHRIGRTGRAGRSGTAITLVAPREWRSFETIMRAMPQPIREVPPPGPTRGRRALVRAQPPPPLPPPAAPSDPSKGFTPPPLSFTRRNVRR